MNDEMLCIRNLQADYGLAPVLKDVTFSVKQGELVGLIGINGGGKSTVLRCISGLLAPKKGEILLHGKSAPAMLPGQRARQVAVVEQSYDIDCDFTVAEMVMLGRNPYQRFRRRETAEDKEMVKCAMEQTNVASFAEKPFRELSGGEKQRVVIARALAQQTDLLLLDEPISALDLQQQVETMELLSALPARGKAVLTVLHDLNTASRYCDRLILLHEGTVLADGTPGEVLTHAHLHRLYDMDLIVRNNPLFDRPEVIPVKSAGR